MGRWCGSLEPSLCLDGALDLDRDTPLHGQREELAVVGGERRRRPRRARALDVDTVVPRLRQLAQEAHRVRREAAPDVSLSATRIRDRH